MDPSSYLDFRNVAANERDRAIPESPFRQATPLSSIHPPPPGRFFAPGVLLSVYPWDWVHLCGGVYDANQDGRRIGDNMFSIAQLSFSIKILGWQGNYRMYRWFNQMPHTRCGTISPRSSGENSSRFRSEFRPGMRGFAQRRFFRFGWRNPQVYAPNAPGGAAHMSWSAGTRINGYVLAAAGRRGGNCHRSNDPFKRLYKQPPASSGQAGNALRVVLPDSMFRQNVHHTRYSIYPFSVRRRRSAYIQQHSHCRRAFGS